MGEHFLQNNIAERIGGNMFGKDSTIYKFEKIKRAKKAATEANPNIPLIDMGVGEPDEMAYHAVVDKLTEEAAKWGNRQYTDNGISGFKVAVAKYMKDVFEDYVQSISSKFSLLLGIYIKGELTHILYLYT